jgi:formamidopyrimidine-DNA glycosylase
MGRSRWSKVPELPDVEGFRRVLARHAGKRIGKVVVKDAGVVRGTSARRFAQALQGRRFRKPSRHGKWLIAPTDGKAAVLFHFGMTGSLSWHRDGAPGRGDERVVFVLPKGELRYRDLRKLQGLRLASSDSEIGKVLEKLGPDALAISGKAFMEKLAGRRRLKAMLMDQTVVAGLGNLLVDEILWRARIQPARKSDRLKDRERKAIFREMRRVLRAAIPTGRVPPRRSWLTGRRDERNGVCPRCGTRLRRATVAGRTTVWCPRCQRR